MSKIVHRYRDDHTLFVLGCCNGLLCFWLSARIICVWNPITNEYRRLPNPPVVYSHPGQCLSGFGYVPSLDDYKLVLLEFINVDDGNNLIRVYSYTLRCNEWELIRVVDDMFDSPFPDNPLYNYFCPQSGVILPNSKSHWVARQNYKTRDCNLILAFDLVTDTSNTVKVPEELLLQSGEPSMKRFLYCLSNIDDKLCIAAHGIRLGDCTDSLQVWKLERFINVVWFTFHPPTFFIAPNLNVGELNTRKMMGSIV
ncbi:F-box protein At4g22390-like [Spinacia oleracea]|uniref:F-box protein At4g22390-like n=1 Tax=Spinacia oleracea TaxID=3562 RepID=A0A9R0I860_SPIOL|nr:F-box protein At4g22390-like [Spinacia oleracea]